MAHVTKVSLQQMLEDADDERKAQIIGRALAAIFQRQTDSEKNANATHNHNNVGFASCDAKSGSLTAKSFLANKTLQKWQVDKWMRVGRGGFPRICKYDRQLSEIAEEKARLKQASLA